MANNTLDRCPLMNPGIDHLKTHFGRAALSVYCVWAYWLLSSESIACFYVTLLSFNWKIGTRYAMVMPSLTTYVESLGENTLFYGLCVGLFSFAKLSSMPVLGYVHFLIFLFDVLHWPAVGENRLTAFLENKMQHKKQLCTL